MCRQMYIVLDAPFYVYWEVLLTGHSKIMKDNVLGIPCHALHINNVVSIRNEVYKKQFKKL